MQITVQLPDDLSNRPEQGREALEALVIEGYRSEALSHHQVSQMLGMNRFQFDGFLKDSKIFDHAYDIDDLNRDIQTLRELQAKGLMPA
jgi:predicted HTH domain antitoxin